MKQRVKRFLLDWGSIAFLMFGVNLGSALWSYRQPKTVLEDPSLPITFAALCAFPVAIQLLCHFKKSLRHWGTCVLSCGISILLCAILGIWGCVLAGATLALPAYLTYVGLQERHAFELQKLAQLHADEEQAYERLQAYNTIARNN